MNAAVLNPAKFLAATAEVDAAAVQPLPNSRKIHVQGSRPDIRVPMREISQSDTPAMFGIEPNPPVTVYDTSGPYSDPAAKIDIRSGLPALRAAWIAERGDTEILKGLSSEFGRQREHDPADPRRMTKEMGKEHWAEAQNDERNGQHDPNDQAQRPAHSRKESITLADCSSG